MRNTRYGLVFLIVFSVLTFGLSSPGNAVTGPTLTIQTYNGLTSLNPDTVNGNLIINTQVEHLTRSGFFYVGQNGELIANTTFGTATIVSERPFKVRYTINKGRVWSDGVPITAADLLVHHISCSSKYAALANISGPNPSSSDADFKSVCYGGIYDQRVLATPTVSSDKLSITVEYDKFFPEWAQVSPMPFPVHALVKIASNNVFLDSAKAEDIKAIFERDVAGYDRNKLLAYAKTWSNAYNLTEISAATNPLLLVSNGGYVVESAVANQSVSLVYNEKYNSGPQVQGIARINFRVIADATVAIQALANREIDLLEAAPTAGGVSSLRNLPNVKIYSYGSGPYEHLDLRVSAAKFGGDPYSGVFAGNSTRAQDLRRAFLLAFPRDQIVEKIIAPINPQAKPLNSLFYSTGESNYSNVVAKNGISAFTQGSESVREAQALDLVRKYFPSASDTNPQVKVNLLWGSPTNARRLALTQLAKASLARAGFDLNATGLSAWSTQLRSSNYDAAIFGWARTDGSTDRNLLYYSTESNNNNMGYTDTSLDNSLLVIQNTNLSENARLNTFVEAENQIYKNSWSLPLFEWPAAFAANSSLANFKPGSNSLPAIWNYWELTLPGAKPFELYVASPTSTDNSSNNTTTQASHQNGGVEVNWSPQVLGPKGSLEQKFVPMALGQVATNPPRWVGANNLDFCWEKLSQYGAGTSCGRIGWGFWSQSGDILTGNFDFALYDGVDFVTLNATQGSTCARLGPSGNLSTANNITCWVGIRIIPNHTYAMKLFADTNYGDNWWQASLTNETTGEVYVLGRIKSLINDNAKKLASTVVRVSYSGVPKSCDDVPIIDTYMTNLVVNGTPSVYSGYQTGSCVKAIVSPNELSQGGYALRMGGEKPETRQLTGKNILVSAANTKPTSSKPTTPSFSGINFVGNKINLSVNIGSNAANLPDKVYLVAPKLGVLATKPLAGAISGNIATWTLGFNKSLAGALIPFEIISEKNGVKSDPATASYQAPTVADAITSVPPTPSKFKSLIIGSSAVITAEVKIQASALATNAYLVSKELGFSSARPLKGEVAGSKIIVEIPIKASMLGKKFPVSIYVTNSKGKSKSLEGVVSIPKAPSTPKAPTTAPDQIKVNCKKGAQERLFDGSCPPGWEES